MTRSLAEDLRTLAHTGHGADDDALRRAVGAVARQMARRSASAQPRAWAGSATASAPRTAPT